MCDEKPGQHQAADSGDDYFSHSAPSKYQYCPQASELIVFESRLRRVFSVGHCQLNGSQPDMTTIYCGYDFFEHPILIISHLVSLKLTMPLRDRLSLPLHWFADQ